MVNYKKNKLLHNWEITRALAFKGGINEDSLELVRKIALAKKINANVIKNNLETIKEDYEKYLIFCIKRERMGDSIFKENIIKLNRMFKRDPQKIIEVINGINILRKKKNLNPLKIPGFIQIVSEEKIYGEIIPYLKPTILLPNQEKFLNFMRERIKLKGKFKNAAQISKEIPKDINKNYVQEGLIVFKQKGIPLDMFIEKETKNKM